MLNNQKNIYLLGMSCLLSFTVSAQDTQEEQKPSKTVNQNLIVIETQVTGSQEQPKVLYIMPWQGIKKPIEIKGNKRILVMPSFRPINTKEFKKQVSGYYQNIN